jgi:hypothetical protein
VSTVADVHAFKGLGDAELGGSLGAARKDRLGSQPDQLHTPSCLRSGCLPTGQDQPVQVRVEQVGIIGQQVIDHPGCGGVAG